MNPFSNTEYLFIAVLIGFNVINYSVEPHYLHTTPQISATPCDIVYSAQRYHYHLLGLPKERCFFDFSSNYCFIRVFINLLQSP